MNLKRTSVMAIMLVVILFTYSSATASIVWIGSSSNVNSLTNWNPNADPFGNDVIFNGTGTTSLTLEGSPFVINTANFSVSNYTFSNFAAGEYIAIGSGLSASSSVNFGTQTMNLLQAQSWSLSGGSTITIGGDLTTVGDWNVNFLSGDNVLKITSSNINLGGSLIVNGWSSNSLLEFAAQPSTALLDQITFAGYAGTLNSIFNSTSNTWVVSAVPEPTSLVLVSMGLVAIGLGLRRRKLS